MTVDTTKKVTVVTQFLKGSNGQLSEIKRFYVQNDVVIPNSESTIAGVSGNSVTQGYCDAQKKAFGDQNVFNQKGGLAQMGDALAGPMVLVMSLWDDHYANMLWLDSTYPATASAPGAARGSCATSSGAPSDVEANVPNSNVVFSNIKFGPIGSTFNSGSAGDGSGTLSSTTTTGSSTTTTRSTSTSVQPPSSTGADHWQQCGGINWTGPKTCKSPYTCTKINDYYQQCL